MKSTTAFVVVVTTRKIVIVVYYCFFIPVAGTFSITTAAPSRMSESVPGNKIKLEGRKKNDRH